MVANRNGNNVPNRISGTRDWARNAGSRGGSYGEVRFVVHLFHREVLIKQQCFVYNTISTGPPASNIDGNVRLHETETYLWQWGAHGEFSPLCKSNVLDRTNLTPGQMVV
jgi:hypothetical protein